MKKKNKFLNICNNVPITQHTVYAIPLSIILGNSAYWPWVYQKFVQVYSSMINGPTIKMRMYYYDNSYAFQEILNIKRVDQVEDIDDIVKFVIDNINNQTYVQMQCHLVKSYKD